MYLFLWVIDFPLFEWMMNKTILCYASPVSSPNIEDLAFLDVDRGKVRCATAHDMVINGVELGGGSIRIHDSKLQNKMFELLGFTPEKQKLNLDFNECF